MKIICIDCHPTGNLWGYGCTTRDWRVLTLSGAAGKADFLLES
jgi:hypothetical protein